MQPHAAVHSNLVIEAVRAPRLCEEDDRNGLCARAWDISTCLRGVCACGVCVHAHKGCMSTAGEQAQTLSLLKVQRNVG